MALATVDRDESQQQGERIDGSVFTRRARRLTWMPAGSRTRQSIPIFASERANQKPS
jgi:hypothetical protein